MKAEFQVHVEPTERGLGWWARTEAVDGLSVAASSLSELRALIDEAVAEHLGPEAEVELKLVVDEPEPAFAGHQAVLMEFASDLPISGAPPGHRVVFVH